jgi:hypothetical protein
MDYSSSTRVGLNVSERSIRMLALLQVAKESGHFTPNQRGRSTSAVNGIAEGNRVDRLLNGEARATNLH